MPKTDCGIEKDETEPDRQISNYRKSGLFQRADKQSSQTTEENLE